MLNGEVIAAITGISGAIGGREMFLTLAGDIESGSAVTRGENLDLSEA